jgi:hypothetical protein
MRLSACIPMFPRWIGALNRGWSSGEMVSRYPRRLAGVLAVNEFGRVWANGK